MTALSAQLGLPCWQGTTLLPTVTSWNTDGCWAASGYSVKFACPCASYFWLIRAMIPAIAGDDTDVPPTTVIVRSPSDTMQSPAKIQIGVKLSFSPAAANNETSGTSRTPSA